MTLLETNSPLKAIINVVVLEFYEFFQFEALDEDSLLGDDNAFLRHDVRVSVVVPEDLIASWNIKYFLFFKFLEVPCYYTVLMWIKLQDDGDNFGIASYSDINNLHCIVLNIVFQLLLHIFALILAEFDVPYGWFIPEYNKIAIHFKVGWSCVKINFIDFLGGVNKHGLGVLTLEVEIVLLHSWGPGVEF